MYKEENTITSNLPNTAITALDTSHTATSSNYITDLVSPYVLADDVPNSFII